MGHDEVYEIGVCERCRHRDPAELLAEDINKIYEWLKKRGLKMMIWSDMINATSTTYKTTAAADMIPKDIVCLDFTWYFHFADDIEDNLLEKGFKVTSTPATIRAVLRVSQRTAWSAARYRCGSTLPNISWLTKASSTICSTPQVCSGVKATKKMPAAHTTSSWCRSSTTSAKRSEANRNISKTPTSCFPKTPLRSAWQVRTPSVPSRVQSSSAQTTATTRSRSSMPQTVRLSVSHGRACLKSAAMQ